MTQVLATSDFEVDFKDYTKGQVIDFADAGQITHLVARGVVNRRAVDVAAAVAAGATQLVHSAGTPASDGLVPMVVNERTRQLTTTAAQAAVRGVVRAVAGARASLIGDSRTRDYYIGSVGKRTNGRNWFAWANAYMGSPVGVVGLYAIAGNRSDQYLAESNFAQMLSDGAEIAVIGYPFVNDIAQAAAGYTDTDGNVVTLANVQSLVVARHLNRVQRLVEVGKTVIVCTEPGATNFNASQTAVVHSVNAALRSTYQGVYGVKVFDPVDLIWSRGTTGSAIAFKSGYSADGTHATTRQGQFVGRYAADKFLPEFFTPRRSYGVNLATATQLFANTGYATTTGGTVQQMTGTDAIPANLLLRAATSGLASYTASTAVAADGTGNELTLTVTTTAATTVRLDHALASVAGLLYTDSFVGGLDVNVTAASNCRVYGAMQLFTNQGTEEGYVLYSGEAADVWTVDGATAEVRMVSDPATPVAGASSGLAVQYRLWMDFKAAGSVTLKLKDPTIYRL